jgi:hypothetical protein
MGPGTPGERRLWGTVNTSEPTNGAGRGPDPGSGRAVSTGERAVAEQEAGPRPAGEAVAGPEPGPGPGPRAAEAPGRRPAGRGAIASHPAARHLILLVAYLAAGIAFTWPRSDYLVRGRLPATRDTEQYVWGFWWVAHQIVHLGNPFFTGYMAAPVGVHLGYHTLMPLPGLVLAPVTLAFGPSASYTLLTVVTPGLLCYAMYRAARLWLDSGTGAVAAGAFFGLSTMVAFQDWYHVNIALGAVFLPMTLEAVIRLRRRPRVRYGVILGLVLGASFLVNQESTVMAALLAAGALVGWLARRPPAVWWRPVVLAGVIAVVVASPQLIAMAQQSAAGGSSATPAQLIHSYGLYGAGAVGLFGPSPRVGTFGLHGLAAVYSYRQPDEGIPAFGLILSLLAVAGLAARWRRRSAWMLALLWLGSAALALGPTLVIGTRIYAPLAQTWQGLRVSLLMPYTWLVRTPGLSELREADRIALLGLVGAAMLAGGAVDWLRRHARPVIVGVAALGVLEAGWSGTQSIGIMPTAMPAVDRPIAADHSGSVVLDVPFGLRGGLGLYGSAISRRALVLATADGHPRSVSYSSWVPAPTKAGITRHPFYVWLAAVQYGHTVPAAKVAGARRDARRMDIGWVLVWPGTTPQVVSYLTDTGFVLDYRADGVAVYRPGRA